MIVSIIFCFFITAESQAARILIRIALFPFIAESPTRSSGLPETVTMYFVNLLSRPGMWVRI